MRQSRIDIGVLGTSTLTIGGVPSPLTARRMRSLLAVLVLGQGQPLSADRIIDAVWDGQPSASARNTLQGYVARLRRLLEPDRQPRAEGELLRYGPGGYQLSLSPLQLDIVRFDTAVAAVQAHLSVLPDLTRPAPAGCGEAEERAHAEIQAALSLWRGDPFTDLGDHGAAVVERRRLEERRVDAQTAAIVLDLTMGRSRSAAVALEELVAAHPLREQLWRLWAVALVRSDRQAHALDVLARLRTTLAAELGIDPSPAANQLQRDILRQDPTVLGSPLVAARPIETSCPPTSPASPAPSASTRPTRVPFVGRAQELELLQGAVHEMRAGAAGHCVVVGETGMGKSRLIGELTDWVRERDLATIATVRNPATSNAPPLWALVRALTQLSAETGVPLPDLGSLTGSASVAPAATELFTTAAAISDFLDDVASVSPVLLVVEDAQWADSATLDTLTYVVEHVVAAPFMALVSQRPHGASCSSDALAVSIIRSGGLSLELNGLDLADASSLATTFPHRDLSSPDVARLHERTAGTPLYLVELLRDSRSRDGSLPPSLTTLIRRDAGSLPPETRSALQVAAVLGPRFSADVVRSCGSVNGMNLAEALEPARSARMIRRRTDGAWEFATAIVHTAMLESIRPLERAALHARVAEAMEDTAIGSKVWIQLIEQWRAAGVPYASRAWRSLSTAAGRAHELLQHAEESLLLGEALEFHQLDADSTEAERFWMLKRRISACRLSFDPEGASMATLGAIVTAKGMDRPDLAAQVAAAAADQMTRRPTLELVGATDESAARHLLLLAAVRTFHFAPDDEIDELVAQALGAAPVDRDGLPGRPGGPGALRTVRS